jgi:hypothetical protein
MGETAADPPWLETHTSHSTHQRALPQGDEGGNAIKVYCGESCCETNFDAIPTGGRNAANVSKCWLSYSNRVQRIELLPVLRTPR